MYPSVDISGSVSFCKHSTMETQMPTEAQKLIALSIGKITQSRQRRGGINLHKNLLVATVLHKARTIYIMENYTTCGPERGDSTTVVSTENSSNIPDTENTKMDTSDEEKGDSNISTESCNVLPTNRGEEKRSRSEHVLVKDTSKKDKENTPPKQHNNNEQMTHNQVKCADDRVENLKSPSHLCDSQTVNLKTNGSNRELTISNRDYVTKGDCQKCVKKRRSSETSTEVLSPVKKPKFEDNSCDSSCDSVPHEHVQSDPTQISNLVSIFNSGFSGLCSVSDSTGVQVYSNTELLSSSSSSVTSYSIDNKSCGTHVKENFVEPVSAIALTV